MTRTHLPISASLLEIIHSRHQDVNRRRIILAILAVCIGTTLGGRGSSEETKTAEKKAEPKVVESPKETAVTKTFDFGQWYVVSDAQLALGQTQDALDMLAAGAVSVKHGKKTAFLLDRIDPENVETILGIEFDHIEIGKPINIKPLKVVFYRFFWDENKRVDGKSADGFVFFESREKDFVSGSLDVNIQGVTKSLQAPDSSVSVNLKGTFRLRLLGIDEVKSFRQGM